MKIKRSSELRSVSAEAEGVRLIWLFGGWVDGSEKKNKSQPGQRGLSSKLCCLSSVLLLLGACVLAVFSRCLLFVMVITTDFKRRGPKCHGRQRLSGKACWLASSPLAEACDWPVLS